LQLQSYYAGLSRKVESDKSPLEFIREKTLAAEPLQELENIQALESEILIDIDGEGIIVSDILEDAETPLHPLMRSVMEMKDVIPFGRAID
jgi:hypothetical protein